MNFLKQSTASQSRIVGPFVDDTDFKTAETGLTVANTDCKLFVNGAASVNKNSGGGTHRTNGFYSLTFDATDTATVGELTVSIVVAGALPVAKTFYVLEEAVFDAMFAASATGVPAGLAAAVWAAAVDGSTTAQESMRLQNAALAGKASGLGTTTAVFRDLADTKDRISATVDADGNRTAVTRDAT
jgi:hypothetical protein